MDLLEYGVQIIPKKQKKIDAHDDIFKKYYVIELFVIILFVLSYIMYGPQSDWLKEYITWKLVWQILFILTINLFVLMFFKFTYGGFKDLKNLLINNIEK